ncbi:MAG: glycosyltransferase family 9 protein [Ktedonobacterales bacterium]
MAFHLRREPQSILVAALCPIGDTLFLTPALAQLRRRFAGARILALVSPSNAGILDGNPDVDGLLLTPERGAGPEWRRFLHGVRHLSREHFDLIINFSAAGDIVTALAGLRAPRLSLQMPPFWMLVGAHTQEYRARHAIDHYFKAIEPLIPIPTDPDERTPRFYLNSDERAQAHELLEGLDIAPGETLVTMHVGGDGYNGRKQWAPDRFATVAAHLIERYRARILLIGGKVDIPLAQEMAALLPDGSAHMLAGATSLKVTGALIDASTLFVGNDSSPLHIAAAVNTPAIGIYGPSDWREFSPVGRTGYRSKLVHSSLPCYPCFRFVGNDAFWYHNPCYTYACLKAIPPEEVIASVEELLGAHAKTSLTR